MAFPPAIRAGNRAANGRIPPFCRRRVLLGAARRLVLLGMMLEITRHTGEVGNLCSWGGDGTVMKFFLILFH